MGSVPLLLLRETETRSDGVSNREARTPALLPGPSLLPHRYCLGSLGDLTISGSPALLMGPLRPSSSDSSAPRRATRPLSPKSCPLGCRSGQLQLDFALFLPGMVRIAKGPAAAESSHRPRAWILHSAASSRPASHHNFLPVAQTAATVTLLSIHHQAGAMSIPLARDNLLLLLLQPLLLLRVPEAAAAGAGAAAAAGEDRPEPLPQPGVPHASFPHTPALPAADDAADSSQSGGKKRGHAHANHQWEQGIKGTKATGPDSRSTWKPRVGGARKKRRRQWRAGRREEKRLRRVYDVQVALV